MLEQKIENLMQIILIYIYTTVNLNKTIRIANIN